MRNKLTAEYDFSAKEPFIQVFINSTIIPGEQPDMRDTALKLFMEAANNTPMCIVFDKDSKDNNSPRIVLLDRDYDVQRQSAFVGIVANWAQQYFFDVTAEEHPEIAKIYTDFFDRLHDFINPALKGNK